ncbi:MAG: diguanylate cyclase, partial [Ardenticatenales bacterium]|nr:diguanylate cyclase [Ardenticatenales bacterium]
QSLRPYDWAGRWQTREFLLVLPDTTLEQAKVVEKRVHEQISAIGLLLPDGTWFKVEPTTGVIEAPPHTSLTIEQLLEEAAKALHESRAQARRHISPTS